MVTLILLALITTLAVAFLALTHRETGAVDALGRTTDSELAADSGLERAKSQITAVLRTRNALTNGLEIMGPDLTVSVAWDTNWLMPERLMVDPSPPVFVNTNRGGTTGPFENRFYHDLNRNTNYEETGYVQVTDVNGRAVPGETNWAVGDPQWVGVLQDPLRPHSPTNRFTMRYAFLIQPIGRSLDLNWIHNQVGFHTIPETALDMNPAGGVNGYFRNQGIGSWELNLAGFLADLNTNYWGDYQYDPFNTVATAIAPSCAAFNDARQLLRYRYMPAVWDVFAPLASPHSFVDTFQDLFPGLAGSIDKDQVDGYGDGPLGPLVAFESIPPDGDQPRRRWPGSDSKRHYYSIHDFFDDRKLPERPRIEDQAFRFRRRLQEASGRADTYDRYTYYTMLAQLGTDSAEEEDDKININYVNIASWLPNPTMTREQIKQQWWAWTNTTRQFTDVMGRPGPELFFLSVVTNLLVREPFLAFTVTNAGPDVPLRIPIYTNGSSTTLNLPIPGPLYSGRLQQILQVAANTHDATTGPKQGEDYPYFPSVFRPQFQQLGNGEVHITNYVLETETAAAILGKRWHDLDLKSSHVGINESPGAVVGPDDYVYGIPLIVGARKGYPNFNELGAITTAEAIRRLEILRPSEGVEAIATNQSLILNITNALGIEAVNPYYSNFTKQVWLFARYWTWTLITNSGPMRVSAATNWVTGFATQIQARAWQGTTSDGAQFRTSPVLQHSLLNWTNVSLPDRGGETNRWGVLVTNHLAFFIVDNQSGQILDAVSFSGPRNYFDAGGELTKPIRGKENRLVGQIWSADRDTSTSSGISRGVASQIAAARTANVTTDREWADYRQDLIRSKTDAIAHFNDFLENKKMGTNQVPFTPRRRIVQTNYFRVNDPLVHYTLEDLDVTLGTTTLEPYEYSIGVLSLGDRNPKSIPWNNGSESSSQPGGGALDPTLRDPGVISPDYWDFPTHRFPSIGWLGRVHRGTAWQTIYLKSKAPTGNWHQHSGATRRVESANLMIPPRDWDLLDIFTTTHHPNATRGRLSINQTNVAAWSAVLSGVLVSGVTNDVDFGAIRAIPEVIQPAALASPLASIVAGINATRGVRPGRQFQRLGHLLSVPELTFQSPFLKIPEFNAEAPVGQARVYDTDYERIPQQILGLVKLGEPRFVIYSWGQSLKPAQRNPDDTGPSIETAGALRGLVRNYQITGEMATRAVVRVDFDRFENGVYDYSRPHLVVESFNVLPNE